MNEGYLYQQASIERWMSKILQMILIEKSTYKKAGPG